MILFSLLGVVVDEFADFGLGEYGMPDRLRPDGDDLRRRIGTARVVHELIFTVVEYSYIRGFFTDPRRPGGFSAASFG